MKHVEKNYTAKMLMEIKHVKITDIKQQTL